MLWWVWLLLVGRFRLDRGQSPILSMVVHGLTTRSKFLSIGFVDLGNRSAQEGKDADASNGGGWGDNLDSEMRDLWRQW